MQIGTATGLRSQVFGSSSLPWGTTYPCIAQLGSASRLGREGRKFESCYTDQQKRNYYVSRQHENLTG